MISFCIKNTKTRMSDKSSILHEEMNASIENLGQQFIQLVLDAIKKNQNKIDVSSCGHFFSLKLMVKILCRFRLDIATYEKDEKDNVNSITVRLLEEQ